MDDLYEHIFDHLERTVTQLAARVPQPKFVQIGRICAFRHVERTINQAIVQKLARMVSTLHAARLLVNHGFVQEQAALQRILDELQEDILFLVIGLLRGDQSSSLHSRYLDSFFAEEFDADTAIDSTQKRHIVPRRKIHAYLASTELSPTDPSRGAELLRTMSRAYSGYVHAASPHIMDMYGGEPASFHVRGMKGTPIYDVHKSDIFNCFYRGVCSCALAFKAFGDEDSFDRIHRFLREVECVSGKDYSDYDGRYL